MSDSGEKLLLQRCDNCGSVQYPPGLICRSCHVAGQTTEVESSRRGVLYSFTIIRESILDTEGAPNGGARVVGLVETSESVRLLALIEASDEDLEVGQPVRLRVVDGIVEGACEDA